MNFNPATVDTGSSRTGRWGRAWGRWGSLVGAAALALTLGATVHAQGAQRDAPRTQQALSAEQIQALERATQTVVGVRATAVEDARSAATLGRQRQGSGIVIDNEGTVLTIGYLILEAESVLLETHDGRQVPARVLAYDLATGFGLVRSLVALKLAPARLGRSPAGPSGDPLLIASGGASSGISLARLVSRRAFSGYWECHIEGALFTTPPRPDHSGAGLFDVAGELIGVGSLFVADAQAAGLPGVPGNMFVPVELLSPILGELNERGASQASHRAWLGISCVEHEGEVLVMRVNEDSPAQGAGLRVRDRIASIDGVAVNSLEVLWKTLWARNQSERPVLLQVRRAGEVANIVVYSVDRAKTLRRPKGI